MTTFAASAESSLRAIERADGQAMMRWDPVVAANLISAGVPFVPPGKTARTETETYSGGKP